MDALGGAPADARAARAHLRPAGRRAGRGAARGRRGVRERRQRLLPRRAPCAARPGCCREQALRAARGQRRPRPTTRPRTTRSTRRSGRPAAGTSRPGRRRGARAGPGWHAECTAMALSTYGSVARPARRRRRPALPAPRLRVGAGRGGDRRHAVRPVVAPRRHRAARWARRWRSRPATWSSSRDLLAAHRGRGRAGPAARPAATPRRGTTPTPSSSAPGGGSTPCGPPPAAPHGSDGAAGRGARARSSTTSTCRARLGHRRRGRRAGRPRPGQRPGACRRTWSAGGQSDRRGATPPRTRSPASGSSWRPRPPARRRSPSSPRPRSDLTRVQPLLEQLAGAVAELLHTDLAAVWTTVPGRATRSSRAPGSASPTTTSARCGCRSATGSAGRAVAERRVVLVEDIERLVRLRRLPRGRRCSTACAPCCRCRCSRSRASRWARCRPTTAAGSRPTPRELELVELYARQAAEMVERARLHAEARSLAALERRRGEQLRPLADAALALSRGADARRAAAPGHRGRARGHRLPPGRRRPGCRTAGPTRRPSSRCPSGTPQWRDLRRRAQGARRAERRHPGEPAAAADRRASCSSTRSSAGCATRPATRRCRTTSPRRWSAATATNLGIVQLSRTASTTQPFTAEDEAVLVQLAQMTSSSVERLEAYERRARRARGGRARGAGCWGCCPRPRPSSPRASSRRASRRRSSTCSCPRLADCAMVHLVDEQGDAVARRAADPRPGRAGQALSDFFADLPGRHRRPGSPAGTVAAHRPAAGAAERRRPRRWRRPRATPSSSSTCARRCAAAACACR